MISFCRRLFRVPCYTSAVGEGRWKTLANDMAILCIQDTTISLKSSLKINGINGGIVSMLPMIRQGRHNTGIGCLGFNI